MRRRMSALAVTAVLAGGLLLSVAPAESASAATRGSSVSVNIEELRAQARNLHAQADRLRHQGHYREANVTEARAQALDAYIQRLVDCERNVRC
ncbi:MULTISPECIES: hypothetical protein [unclassified Streptomyces]|uniref:hypothetical protein n=1 Tax=Streptomycetaceae TaxID=2062 RepID=UPI002E79C624|nr:MULTISPECIES: hypothetical protein [unclassified Streptomyces]MED7952339.1 hypothetical protein [Streptomyces sp. BE303]MEE1826250.1 hypothetical protein [Streptomyces sp. BE20]